jgi:hypothetical protein
MPAAGGAFVVAFATFVVLHRADGEPVAVNPRHVSAVTPAHDGSHFAEGIHCIVHQGGKFISVKEKCAEVHRLLHHQKE